MKDVKHEVGIATEYKAATVYTQRGYTVCWPMLTQSLYDFVAEKDGTFLRVQVKTATWSKSGKHKYLQCRLGADKRSGNDNSSGNKYVGHCDEILFLDPESNDIWIFPTEVLKHTSNVCLATTKEKPNKSKRTYDVNSFKL